MTTEIETPNPAPDSQAESTEWGDNFDAERAKKLIENLRADKEALRKRLTAAESARDEAQAQAERLEGDLNAARRDHAMADILREHPELEALADRIKGESVEELRADAEALANALKGVKPKEEAPAPEPAEEEDPPQDGEEAPAPEESNDPEPESEPKPASRPTPKVRPAHGGDEPRPFDPAAIAARARANR